ncbi:MAG: hypothetical protein AB1593_04735 [Pseudomonadota bacterium]
MSTLKPATKIHNIASHLYDGERLTMFDAERLGDHVLRTTVATLERRGATIARRMVSRPTRFGADAHVCEYWVEPEHRPALARLLGLDVHIEHSPAPDARAYLFQSRGG